MLNGRAVVFLSCSEKFKAKVAFAVREALGILGIHGVIVSEEPQLPRTGWTPDDKVESYLDASDAFVALCTSDDQLADGTIETRQNIIDEIQRARNKPHLRDRLMVLKAESVKLPSNINPTYENLEPDGMAPSVDRIERQLRIWGVLADPGASPPVAPIPPPPRSRLRVDNLLSMVNLGEADRATALAYVIAMGASRHEQRGTVEDLVERLRETANDTTLEDNTEIHIMSSVLGGIGRIDPTIIPLEVLEELSISPETTHRIAAVDLIWDLADAAPGLVPLGVLGRLALPATEDWYVQAPAMAVVKLLMLSRRYARVIFDELSVSKNPQDRYEVAAALLDLAGVEPSAVPPDLAERLAKDRDELVARKAEEVRKVIESLPKRAYWKRFAPFGI